MTDQLPTTTAPVMLVRLSSRWHQQWEEIEPGYFRDGHGWREGMTPTELHDSVRAWWRLSPEAADRRGVQFVAAVARGATRALYRLEGFSEPRKKDGRRWIICSPVTSGAEFEEIVGQYGKTVTFPKGDSNPIRYWAC